MLLLCRPSSLRRTPRTLHRSVPGALISQQGVLTSAPCRNPSTACTACRQRPPHTDQSASSLPEQPPRGAVGLWSGDWMPAPSSAVTWPGHLSFLQPPCQPPSHPACPHLGVKETPRVRKCFVGSSSCPAERCFRPLEAESLSGRPPRLSVAEPRSGSAEPSSQRGLGLGLLQTVSANALLPLHRHQLPATCHPPGEFPLRERSAARRTSFVSQPKPGVHRHPETPRAVTQESSQ